MAGATAIHRMPAARNTAQPRPMYGIAVANMVPKLMPSLAPDHRGASMATLNRGARTATKQTTAEAEIERHTDKEQLNAAG